MRDWLFDIFIPLMVTVVIVTVLSLVGYTVVSGQQGYDRWVDKLEAQNGTLVCEDKGFQIVRFER